MSTVRCVLRLGSKGGNTIRGDPIAKLDYFAAVDGRHENGRANWQQFRAHRLVKAHMSMEDGESFGPLDKGHGLPHSLDVQTTKNEYPLTQCYCYLSFSCVYVILNGEEF